MKKILLLTIILALNFSLLSAQSTSSKELKFKNNYHLRGADSTYTDTLQLVYSGKPLNGLSFKIRAVPDVSTPSAALFLTGVQKGSDIENEAWNFFFEKKETDDTTYFIVLIYGQDSTTLPPGTYNDFVRFTYDVNGVSESDTLMTYINLYEVESSHINGDPAEVTAGENQLIEIVNQITSVEPFLPYEYSLEQNYPNPFNPSTTIEFYLKHAGEIEIKIYNLLGQEVKTLFSGHLGNGFYSVKWDGRNNESTPLSSGAYIYKLTTDNFVQSKKMLLLK